MDSLRLTDSATADGVFEFGTLTLTNGIFFNQASFDVTFTTVSSDPLFNGRTFSDTISYVVTPNLGVNDLADADYIEVRNHPELGRVHVDEAGSPLGNTGTVELWGRVGSLDPLFFADPTGGVALDVTAVPEPSEWLLMLAGFVAMATMMSRSRRSVARRRLGPLASA
ncbi:MAG TPA: PEP-CTERM sorting domain-containing protein [Caldimonas sp.]